VNPVDVLGLNLEAGDGAAIVLLREQEPPRRVLPIVIGGGEAVAIASALSRGQAPRPLTHDLLGTVIDTLDARIDHVEVTAVREDTVIAELIMDGPRGPVGLDSRPSDAIGLAVLFDAPVFASDDVLEQAGAHLSAAAESRLIDVYVERFRNFLDGVDAADFEAPYGPEEPPDGATS
jgi:bifunctional DNase/RNase